MFSFWGECIMMVGVVLVTALITGFLIHRREERKVGEFQDKILKKQRDEVLNIYQTMRGWRHDYHNHIQTIKAYLSMNRIEETLTYLDHLEEDLDCIDIAIRTGNVSLDAILSSKLSIASKKEIRVDWKACLPRKITLTDIDLCTIVGNLLDNAMEACEKIPKEKRFLRVYIGVLRKQLYISVMNATGEKHRKKLSEFITTKQGNHGLGLRRIQTIIEKYNGYIKQENEPGVFATEILLPL